MAEQHYDILLRKLDEFIRKYYKNQLIRGGLYTLSLVLIAYLAIVALEYFGHFGSSTRTVLFYGFLGIALFVMGRFLVLPFFRLLRLGKVISHEEASRIIGAHFPEVQDKLLNTLQLHERSVQADDPQQAELIRASIDQRIGDLQPVPFGAAIDLRENRRYLKYALPPLLLFLILLFASPTIITDSTERIVKHTRHFEREAPFRFMIQNEDLEVIEQEDFDLEVKVTGDVLPDQAYINMGGDRFRLEKKGSGRFRYRFRNVKEPVTFQLSADGFDSRSYELKTLPDPMLLNFQVHLEYPAYLDREDKKVRNTGDLVIPEGTKVKWDLTTKNTDKVLLALGDSTHELRSVGEGAYRYAKRFMESTTYTITTANQYIQSREPIEYHITVQPDQYPEIQVKEEPDSLNRKKRYFMGRIADDQGFTRLTFNYKYIRTGSDSARRIPEGMVSQELPVEQGMTRQEFFHDWDMGELDIRAGDELQYYFEVWDNDQVNGAKSTRTRTLTYTAPTLEELSEMEEKDNQVIKKDLKEGLDEARELQQKLDQISRDMLDKKQLSWQEKKKVRELLEQQKELEKKVEGIKEQNRDKNQRRSELQQQDEEILKKQEQLQKLLDQVMTEEMKKMFRELEKLMEEMDKEELQEQIEKMNMSNEEIEKELDRSLEIFKQLEFEKKLNETINRLNKLQQEQEKLSEKAQDPSSDPESLKQQQDSLNKAFEKVREDLDSLEQKDKAMQTPNGMKDTEEKEKAIGEQMKESSQQLQQGQKKDASGNQKDASQKMKQLSQELQKMQQSMQSQAIRLNMEALRALLENLIQLSFDQETLMDDLQNTSKEDPGYVKIGQRQKKLKDDAAMIEDSLYALSKRVVQLEATINKQIDEVNQNMEQAIGLIAERKTGNAASKQQYVMTALNELALLLDEALQSMQKQMAQQMQGKSNCQKPGSGQKPSLSQMRKMQQQLGKKIQQLKKGQKPDGKQPGGKKGQGQKMSKEIARMAARQAAIRRKIEKLSQELQQGKSGQGDELRKIAEQMEKNEEDLVNKKFDREMKERLKEIETRLLKSEKAEREREYEKKRESEVAKNENYSNLKEYFKYKREKQQEVELLKTVPPSLKPYYKERVNRYFDRSQQ